MVTLHTIADSFQVYAVLHVMIWLMMRGLHLVAVRLNSERHALIEKHYQQAHKQPVVACFDGDCHLLSN